MWGQQNIYSGGQLLQRGAPPMPGPPKQQLEPIDWNLVAILDPDIIRRAKDYDSLQKLIQIFATARLVPGCSRILAHPLCMRLCQLLQIGIEYMNYCQKQLQENLNEKMQELTTLKSQNDKNEHSLQKLHTILKAKSQPFEKCPICRKKFKDMDYVDHHVLKRHPELTDAWNIVRGKKKPESPEENDRVQVILEKIESLRESMKKHRSPSTQNELEATQLQLQQAEEAKEKEAELQRELIRKQLFEDADTLGASLKQWEDQKTKAPPGIFNIFNAPAPPSSVQPLSIFNQNPKSQSSPKQSFEKQNNNAFDNNINNNINNDINYNNYDINDNNDRKNENNNIIKNYEKKYPKFELNLNPESQNQEKNPQTIQTIHLINVDDQDQSNHEEQENSQNEYNSIIANDEQSSANAVIAYAQQFIHHDNQNQKKKFSLENMVQKEKPLQLDDIMKNIEGQMKEAVSRLKNSNFGSTITPNLVAEQIANEDPEYIAMRNRLKAQLQSDIPLEQNQIVPSKPTSIQNFDNKSNINNFNNLNNALTNLNNENNLNNYNLNKLNNVNYFHDQNDSNFDNSETSDDDHHSNKQHLKSPKNQKERRKEQKPTDFGYNDNNEEETDENDQINLDFIRGISAIQSENQSKYNNQRKQDIDEYSSDFDDVIQLPKPKILPKKDQKVNPLLSVSNIDSPSHYSPKSQNKQELPKKHFNIDVFLSDSTSQTQQSPSNNSQKSPKQKKSNPLNFPNFDSSNDEKQQNRQNNKSSQNENFNTKINSPKSHQQKLQSKQNHNDDFNNGSSQIHGSSKLNQNNISPKQKQNSSLNNSPNEPSKYSEIIQKSPEKPQKSPTKEPNKQTKNIGNNKQTKELSFTYISNSEDSFSDFGNQTPEPESINIFLTPSPPKSEISESRKPKSKPQLSLIIDEDSSEDDNSNNKNPNQHNTKNNGNNDNNYNMKSGPKTEKSPQK